MQCLLRESLDVHVVSFSTLEDGGSEFKKLLAAAPYSADFEPPLVFINGTVVGRNGEGISPHDYMQAAISFEGPTEIEFDDERGIVGSIELDALIRSDMVQPAKEATGMR